jgi:hypothetical protein
MSGLSSFNNLGETIARAFGGKHTARGRAAGGGATAGAAIGSAVAGPAGAVVGAAIGGGVAVVLHEKYSD